MEQSEEIAVSIICTTYNHEKYIRQTLQSFVDQITTFRYEIIVHDDASTDGTRKIIKEFVKKYPDLFVPILQTENQHSKGKGMVIRTIAEKARGKYWARCEGDDYWCDCNKLQLQYQMMEEYPECTLCVHKVKCINEDGSNNETRKFPSNHLKVKEGILTQKQLYDILWLRGEYPFHTSSYFIRSEIEEKIVSLYALGGWPNYTNGDMAILWVSSYHGHFYYIDKVMSKRRLNVPGSYNDRLKKSTKQNQQIGWERHLQAIKMFDEYTTYKLHSYILYRMVNLTICRGRKGFVDPRRIFDRYNLSFDEVYRHSKTHNKLCVLCMYKWLRGYMFIKKIVWKTNCF